MLNERKFTDQQTSRDERAIDSLLKQAQISSHSGDGTSKFSEMARDRAALLRKTQKHLKKSKRLRDSVEYEEDVINEEDPHVSADPRHPANQRSNDQSGSGRTHPYVHTNPHTGKKVRTRLGTANHIHPTTGASKRTDGVFDEKTRGIPAQKPVTDSERNRLKTANEGYGPGPSYGKKALKGFRRFESKPGKVDELNTSTLKSYISKANKSADNSMDTAMDGDTRSEREKATHKVNRRRKGVRNAERIIKQRASDAGLDWENSDDPMDSRVIN